MDPIPHHDAPWNSLAWSNPSPIQIPSRRFSVRSDRERDATEYARALSSDVTPYAASIISSSDSNSYYRSSRGSRSSIASSLLCPLLDFHDSSRRQSDAGVIMPMRPLPVIHPSPDPLPSSNHLASHLNCWTQEPFSITKQTNGSAALSSSTMSNSTSTSGSNLFIPLRRRFLPNIDRTSAATKPRVETQLFGELLLALEEYVAAFGRRVKVSAPHQFSLGDSAAAVVVAAAAGPSNDHSFSESNTSDLDQTAHDIFSDHLQLNQDTPSSSTDQEREAFKSDDAQLDPWGQNSSEGDQSSEQLDQTSSQTTNLNSQSQCKVNRTLLSELCDELEYVTSEVIDVVPAFGEKLMQGHYGPLAVRGRVASANKLSSVSGPTDTINQPQVGGSQPKPSTALERFVDYEPGGSQDTSDGGSGWWAERLLRDLLEGILAETVVKSGSTRVLLSTHSNLTGAESVNIIRLSSQNSSDQSSNNEKTSARKINSISLGGKSKNWLRIPQSTNLVRSSSVSNVKSLSNRNLGFLHIDEEEETSTIPEGKRKNDNRNNSKNPFNIRSANSDIVMVGPPSNSTRQLLAEASQDSIFEYPSFFKDQDNQNKLNSLTGHTHARQNYHEDVFNDPRQEELIDPPPPQGSKSIWMMENKEEKVEMNDQHRQKLLDEGRKRWLAFKANQLETHQDYSHPSVSDHHRHTINNPLNFLSNNNHSTPQNHHQRDGFNNHPFLRDSNTLQNGRSRANSHAASLRNQSNHHRYLYNYLANHRS